MAGQSEIGRLRKRRHSIRTAYQISNAMKVVSTAKYARCSTRKNAFAAYSAACGDLSRTFGDEISRCLAAGDPSAPACFVLFSSNRGLCGSFNHDIFAFADEILAADPGARVISCQKQFSLHLAETGREFREILLPDVPDPSGEDFVRLYDVLRGGFLGGEFSAVTLVYQKYKNMLSQTPTAEPLLPLSRAEKDAEGSSDEKRGGAFCFPDRGEVLNSAAALVLRAALYTAALSASASAQAATLMAMRAACDSAAESERQITAQISRMRQSAITEDVIETSSDLFSDE